MENRIPENKSLKNKPLKNMTLKNIADACHGKLVCSADKEETLVCGVVLDSRLVENDYLFIATKGEKVDGHEFIGEVVEKGAICVVCEKKPEIECAYILVEDSFVALKDVAEFYRKQLTIPIIGITGSVGKTSTKEFIAGVLGEKYNVLKTDGNFNNEVGLPLTVLRIREEHQAAVLEMGINQFGEMHRLSRVARPDICVITNIGQCHLENLGSREGILKAKTEIFDFMNQDGCVCINGDDDMLQSIETVYGKKPMTYGFNISNRVYADKIQSLGLFGSKATIHMDDKVFEVQVPLPGEHMVMNALAATVVGSLLGLKPQEIANGIAAVKPVGGRSNLIRTQGFTLIDDCYNANPVSMKAAIDLLLSAETRTVAILGDMFELGENSEKMHAQIGEYAVKKGVDVVLCVGENSKAMYQAALKTKQNMKQNEIVETTVLHMTDRADVLTQIGEILQKGDTVLIKASHGMGFDCIVKQLQK